MVLLLRINLGVRERNLGDPYLAFCPKGPFHFQQGQMDNQCDALHCWSPHSGGTHFLFADASGHFLAYAADDVLPALAARAGGEAASPPD